MIRRHRCQHDQRKLYGSIHHKDAELCSTRFIPPYATALHNPLLKQTLRMHVTSSDFNRRRRRVKQRSSVGPTSRQLSTTDTHSTQGNHQQHAVHRYLDAARHCRLTSATIESPTETAQYYRECKARGRERGEEDERKKENPNRKHPPTRQANTQLNAWRLTRGQ